MTINPTEIRDGLVLHLDPDELEAAGGTCTGAGPARVQGSHFFVCIASDERSGNWVPLFSAPGPGRELVPNEAKSGHPRWCESATWYPSDQVWQAPHAAAIAAAIAGGDLSGAGVRNALSEAGVDLIYAAALG